MKRIWKIGIIIVCMSTSCLSMKTINITPTEKPKDHRCTDVTFKDQDGNLRCSYCGIIITKH